MYRIHEGLCRHGFGSESLYRVPESVGYIDENATVLLRPATGDCLGELEARDWAAFEEGVTRAARWLAALHASRLTLGPHENLTHGTSRLARRAAKAAARRPDLVEMFRKELDELGTRHGAAGEPSALVQTHGRYHGGHVFVATDCVTAVDLDRAALADPAKDVGEFVLGLRWIAARKTIEDSAVDDLCEAFLNEYIRHGPGVPHELTYYLSYCIVWALVRLAFGDRPSRKGWEERTEFLKAEFDDAPRRAAAWLTHVSSGGPA